MPKLRNATSDIGGFVQWLARKCVNHNPLEELQMVGRATKADRYKSKVNGDIGIVADGTESVLFYKSGERAFKITVEEVPATTYGKSELMAIGN